MIKQKQKNSYWPRTKVRDNSDSKNLKEIRYKLNKKMKNNLINLLKY